MKRLLITSRCSWTIYNFRRGIVKKAINEGYKVYCASLKDEYTSKLLDLGVEFTALPLSKRGLNIFEELSLLFSFIKLIQSIKPDIIHNFTIKPVIYSSIATLFFKKPKVVNSITGLGYVFSEESSAWLKIFIIFLYKIVLGRSYKVFFQNEDDLNTFLKHKIIKREKAILVPGSGVDIEHFSKKVIHTNEKELESKKVKFVMVSRLIKSKGVYEYVNAAKILKKKKNNVSFTLVGGLDDGNDDSIDEKLFDKWKKESLIDIIGEVEDVRLYLANSDVLVLPTRYKEGIPKSIIEAGAMGLCVITTNIPGNREVIKDRVNGLLIEPKRLSSEELAKHMLILVNDRVLLNKLKKSARNIIRKRFDEKFVIDKIFDVYEHA